MMLKPVAYDIDCTRRNIANLPREGGYAVLYKCPSCDTPLCVWLGEKELFCHNCGEALFWGGVITHINSQQSNLIDNDKEDIFKTNLLHLINESVQAENDMATTCYIVESE